MLKKRYPSVKTLGVLTKDREVAKRIRGILTGAIEARSVEQTDRWVRRCFHEPRGIEQQLHAIDVLLGNHGVEELGEGESLRWPQYSYSNTGDSYATTIVRDHANGRWLVTSWGNLVEAGKVRE